MALIPMLSTKAGRQNAAIVGGTVTVLLLTRKWTASVRRRRARAQAAAIAIQEGKSVTQAAREKKSLNKRFIEDLRSLLKIVIPGLKSKEARLLGLHTAFLFSRTLISIYIAKLDGILVKSIVDRKVAQFWLRLCHWMAMGIPACFVNSMIKYLESQLGQAFRNRLTQHAIKRYMTAQVFYSVSNLDSRISNVDQLLTDDVSRFCDNLAHLYSQLSKPVLDVILMSTQLVLLSINKIQGGGSAAVAPTTLGVGVMVLTNQLLRAFAPPFGALVAEQAKLEGQYRGVHSRVITHSEEIAFYRGQPVEKSRIMDKFRLLLEHSKAVAWRRVPYGVLEGLLMKYTWSSVGLVMIALPNFYGKASGGSDQNSTAGRTQNFVTARRLLLDTSEAIERIMSAYKDVLELAGYANRVASMLRVYDDVEVGKFSRNKIASAKQNPGQDGSTSIQEMKGGEVAVGDDIKLEKVPIVTPNGDVLVQSLDLTVRSGEHTLITGPNGCGKSSLFRILGGLWPPCGGKVQIPKSMFYIPQRPYLCEGTLRDQILYPHTPDIAKQNGVSDAQLEDIFEVVSLSHVLKREGGWDAAADWQDRLSGGEKQRLAMARLFYHHPRFAILDECTSAVSIDVEGRMYQHAKDLGITLLTVTHRPTLFKYHDHLLKFDGTGGWQTGSLDAQSFVTLSDERNSLFQKLKEVPKLQARLKEVCTLLGETPPVIQPMAANPLSPMKTPPPKMKI